MCQNSSQEARLSKCATILSDDLPEWMSDIRENEDFQSEPANGGNQDWLDEVQARRPESKSDRGTTQAEPPERLTMTILQESCGSCDISLGLRYHESCGAPIAVINGVPQCAGCGRRTSTNNPCPNCNSTLNSTRYEIPLDLRLGAIPTDLEQEIHAETNQRRNVNGLDTLEYSHHLSSIALQHSRNMAEQDFIDHESPKGLDAADRYRKFNHKDRSVGENIACIQPGLGTSGREAALSVVEDWMDSPGHRGNILNGHFATEGIGVYFDSDGSMFVTQNFS